MSNSSTRQALHRQATFICGHPKSGTSLLLAMLDSHPELIVFPEETAFFRRFHREAASCTPEERAGMAEDLILHVFHWDPDNPHPTQSGFLDRDYRAVDAGEVIQAYRGLLQNGSAGYPDILAAAVVAYGSVRHLGAPEAIRWVEKTPYNEFFAELIFSYWPEARCLHIVRDPRDNYASYRRKHPDWRPRTFARSWAHSIQRGWSNERRYGPDRYLIVRYEDLVQRPERSIEVVSEFLGIRDDPALRQPTRDARPWAGNSMFGQEFDVISQTPLGRFQDELETDAGKTLEAFLTPEMAKLRYDRYYPRAWLQSLAAIGIRGVWKARDRLAGGLTIG